MSINSNLYSTIRDIKFILTLCRNKITHGPNLRLRNWDILIFGYIMHGCTTCCFALENDQVR